VEFETCPLGVANNTWEPPA